MKALFGIVLVACTISLYADEVSQDNQSPPPTIRSIPYRRGSPERDAQNAANDAADAAWRSNAQPLPQPHNEGPDPRYEPPKLVVPAPLPNQTCDICLSQGFLGRMSISKTDFNPEYTSKKTLWECERGHYKSCTSQINNENCVCGKATSKSHTKNLLNGWKTHNTDLAISKSLPRYGYGDINCPICASQNIDGHVSLLCGWTGAWNLEGAKVPRQDYYQVSTYTCDRGHCIVVDKRIVRHPDGKPFAAGMKVKAHKNLAKLQAANLIQQQFRDSWRNQAEAAKNQAVSSTSELVEKIDGTSDKVKEVGLRILPPAAPLTPSVPSSGYFQIDNSPNDPMSGYDVNFDVPLKPLP